MCVSDLSLLALPRDLVLEGIIQRQRPPPVWIFDTRPIRSLVFDEAPVVVSGGGFRRT